MSNNDDYGNTCLWCADETAGESLLCEQCTVAEPSRSRPEGSAPLEVGRPANRFDGPYYESQ